MLVCLVATETCLHLPLFLHSLWFFSWLSHTPLLSYFLTVYPFQYSSLLSPPLFILPSILCPPSVTALFSSIRQRFLGFITCSPSHVPSPSLSFIALFPLPPSILPSSDYLHVSPCLFHCILLLTFLLLSKPFLHSSAWPPFSPLSFPPFRPLISPLSP